MFPQLSNISPIWEETHQKTDKTGPKAHQWAVGPRRKETQHSPGLESKMVIMN